MGIAAMTKIWMAYGQKEYSDSKSRDRRNDHEIEIFTDTVCLCSVCDFMTLCVKAVS